MMLWSQVLAIQLNWGAAVLRPYGMVGADKNSCWSNQQPIESPLVHACGVT